ncbi:MAG: 16S rRNA (cytidine(1402)-2'-O)-methyltransferase [Polyangiales bacterium]
MAGTLYVVSTPIGNLDDLTVRASKVLASVDAVLAEDTRRSRNLLSHLGLSKPLRRFDAHVESGSVERTAKEIAEGANLALVSDAGTPLISDPGSELVRATLAAGGQVVAVPGASAVLCALVASGLAGGGVRLFGFLPRSGAERADAIARAIDTPEPVVFYEAGNRTLDTIRELAARAPERPAAVARELTKLHEELVRGTLKELENTLEEPRGEVTIVLGAAPARTEALDDDAIDARIDQELGGGRSAKDTADVVAALSGRPRREIYARVVARRSR